MSGYSTKQEALLAAMAIIDAIEGNIDNLPAQIEAVDRLDPTLEITIVPSSQRIVEVKPQQEKMFGGENAR